MKETALKNDDLGNYVFKVICQDSHVQYGNNGCTEVGEIRELHTMPYYWSDKCHDHRYIYGNDT